MHVAEYGMLFLLSVCLHVFLAATSVLVALVSIVNALLQRAARHSIEPGSASKDKTG